MFQTFGCIVLKDSHLVVLGGYSGNTLFVFGWEIFVSRRVLLQTAPVLCGLFNIHCFIVLALFVISSFLFYFFMVYCEFAVV